MKVLLVVVGLLICRLAPLAFTLGSSPLPGVGIMNDVAAFDLKLNFSLPVLLFTLRLSLVPGTS